jgi:hypothetical protein
MVIGGRNSENKVINSVETYDTEKNIWLTAPSLPEPVARATIHEYLGDLLVVGGQSLSSEPRKIYRFRFNKGWAALDLSPLPVGTFSAVSIMVKKEFCISSGYVHTGVVQPHKFSLSEHS